MKRAIATLGVLLTIPTAGCKPSANTPEPPPVKAASAPGTSPDEWKATVQSTFSDYELLKTGDDGDTEFRYCLGGKQQDGKCQALVLGKRDPFRRIYFLKGTSTLFSEHLEKVYARPYLAAKDCGAPIFFLDVNYKGKSWLFINQLSFLVNGELGIELAVDRSAVDRNTDDGEVSEQAHVALTSAQIEKVRQLATAQDVKARFVGDKGYLMASKDHVKGLQMDLSKMLKVYDALNTKTAALPSCAKQQ